IVDKNWHHVTRVADRNVVLAKGEVVFAGTSDELRAQPAVLERYLGV
ncbi:MAG TPA: ABC transporter ATP-binding protein, partial [Ramlibacter sp.]